MAQISAALVKELRDKTGAGMMDCKKALSETDGDVEEAIDWLRKKGVASAAKKAGRVADDLIEKAGLGSGNVEQITETAKQIGEKAAEKAGVVVEKVKETANRAIVRAEELAEDGKDAALEAADDLGDTINTGK